MPVRCRPSLVAPSRQLRAQATSCRPASPISSRILTVVSSLCSTSPLGRLPDQFLEGRLELLGLALDDVPLGRGRQGNAQVPLQASRGG